MIAGMKRRAFITLLGGAVAWPLAVRAQQAGRTRRIGFLTSSSPVVSIESSYHAGLLRGMRELGYVVGKDFIVEWRFAEGKLERFAEFAAELVRLNIDVFVLGTPTAVPAVRQATSSIPIVMGFSTDPVGNGFIASLARPGGNITGVASSQDDAVPKQMELLTMLVPDLSRIGLLVDPSSPNSSPIVKNAQAVAGNAGLLLVPAEARNLQEVEGAFTTLTNERVGAIIVVAGSVLFFYREPIAQLALKHRLPSIFPLREFVEAGMSYGESLFDFYRRAAVYVDKIFKGAKPADLPVEQPTRLFLIINRKTVVLLLTVVQKMHPVRKLTREPCWWRERWFVAVDYVNSMGMTTDAPPPTIPVNFLEDALTETTIAVGDRAEDVCAGHLASLA
jgi:putative ABC transport system substrate-binding protein